MKRQFAELFKARAYSLVAPFLFSAMIVSPAKGDSLCQKLALNAGHIVQNYVTDQYVWYDSRCRQRSASLVLFNEKGGHAKEFTYTLPDGSVRTVGESGDSGAAGFGYIVSHLEDASLANSHGEDDSPLGSSLAQNSRVVFQGKHHAIHEFTLNYPRWGTNPATGEVKKYDVPVTIQWMFATGRDNPLWSVTYDLSQAPANAISADTRAPYGDMNFDGAPAHTWSDEIGGVAWGDSYQFSSLGNKLTLNTHWSWKNPNGLAPYNFMWTANADAEMGISGTRISAKQDAGGYKAFGGRGQSSDDMYCSQDAAIGLPKGHVMPCSSGWPFQSVNYSFWDASGNPTANQTTPSKRLAWGTDFGYLGQQTMTTINLNTVFGWPRVSYSTYITLGRRSDEPTINQALEALVADNLTLTVGNGGFAFPMQYGIVAASGPAGVGRTDTMDYSPKGYNPVYGTFEVIYNFWGKVVVNFASQMAYPIIDPVIVVRSCYGCESGPKSVQISTEIPGIGTGTQDLIADQDYFVSYRGDTHDLWMTIHKPLMQFTTRSTVTITF